MKVVDIDPGTAPSNLPARVRQAVCGYGRAEKTRVQRMSQVLPERTPTPRNAGDALAVATCHALAPRLLQATG